MTTGQAGRAGTLFAGWETDFAWLSHLSIFPLHMACETSSTAINTYMLSAIPLLLLLTHNMTMLERQACALLLLCCACMHDIHMPSFTLSSMDLNLSFPLYSSSPFSPFSSPLPVASSLSPSHLPARRMPSTYSVAVQGRRWRKIACQPAPLSPFCFIPHCRCVPFMFFVYGVYILIQP